jgi:hypothetical protein
MLHSALHFIPVYFQWLQMSPGESVRHGCNMIRPRKMSGRPQSFLLNSRECRFI